jgi:septum formation protein
VSLLLASASPRRADLLAAAGLEFRVVSAEVDERRLPDEAPDAYVRRLALAKASAIGSGAGQVVLGADTVVVVDADCLGKPRDDDEARAMLARLSGRVHEVLTGVALVAAGRAASVDVVATRVTFHRLDAAEIAWYVASGEPRDKAGAYAIQGFASRFIAGIEGSYANVVGLPVDLVYRRLKALDAAAL